MKVQTTILFCILDWGLGHATRSVPVIQEFQKYPVNIIIGTDGKAEKLLKKEFPGLRFVSLPSYSISYSKRKNLAVSLLKQAPKLIKVGNAENKIIEKIAIKHNIKLIISDNRYGCRHKNIHSIFITHVLNILFPRTLSPLQFISFPIHRFFIKKFDECWIPDYDNDLNLSGKMSQNLSLPIKQKYVGALSRFQNKPLPRSTEKIWDLLIVLSGPEPQRSILENILLTQLKKLSFKSLFIKGLPDNQTIKVKNLYKTEKKLTIISFLNSEQLYQCMSRSEMIICRSGYSSVMDLVALRKKALLIPTPGQTEQEYLGRYLMKKNLFFSVEQQHIKLEKNIKEAMQLKPDYSIFKEADVLKTRVKEIMNKIQEK